MKVMISGHFDPFHDKHLEYFKEAAKIGGVLICVVSSDSQIMRKKGKVNIPERGRCEIVNLVLTGLGVKHVAVVNRWDIGNSSVANALRYFKPDIFYRGNDKILADMPELERTYCDELGIRVIHAHFKGERHGRAFVYA